MLSLLGILVLLLMIEVFILSSAYNVVLFMIVWSVLLLLAIRRLDKDATVNAMKVSASRAEELCRWCLCGVRVVVCIDNVKVSIVASVEAYRRLVKCGFKSIQYCASSFDRAVQGVGCNNVKAS